jgi:hypothetical protein
VGAEFDDGIVTAVVVGRVVVRGPVVVVHPALAVDESRKRSVDVEWCQ